MKDKMNLDDVQGKLSRSEMKNIIGGAMACATCSEPNTTMCVSYNPNEKNCQDTGYNSVFCVNTTTGEQVFHDCPQNQ